ncbi:TonB-dependent Receptor Plug Domain [Lishizhenia tianjinensis]|uniref:TonB-dependent Receptor Plug Domain n=1 Tax=Lishizhenia tianjinensis TaxID=477690 RepID=A0A1I7AH86_9FLAO|nr:TonB-dependent receptor [Lishizhenia tianjinensis]SFT74307.1 TonB-dependent Receptor Plug Domain [Lishizhenia tianjinensis]
MKLLHLTFFLLLSSLVWGQTASVEGRVVDKDNDGFYGATIYVQEDSLKYHTRSNSDGYYQLQVPSSKEITLIIYSEAELFSYTLNLAPNESKKLPKTKFSIQNYTEVEIAGTKKENIASIEKIDINAIPIPGGSVERSLIYSTAASSNNELSNNYNVRGGNYNENLVYVNNILIYRPFLTRSGQQEGMSFINPDFVEDISFSAGGFSANYGDRLSSVLDITYKKPKEFKATANGSLLGASFHVEDKISPRFNYIVGARYRSNGYLLNALPTTGAYNPIFFDVQFLTNYELTEKLTWSFLGHLSSNNYRFAPITQVTNFGTINEAYSFRVYFDGQEQTRFRTFTGATSLNWNASKRLKMNAYASVFNTNESENFTVRGQYFINQLETDPSKENVGDSIATLGVGTYIDHGRNELNARIYALAYNGEYQIKELIERRYFDEYKDKGKFTFGIRGQVEQFDDVLSEWRMLDSAGYSLPQAPSDEIELYNVIKAQNTLHTFRANGYIMYSQRFEKLISNYPAKIVTRQLDSLGKRVRNVYYDTVESSKSRWSFNAGLRGGYTAFNNEFYITPRANISFFPKKYYVKNGETKRRYVRYHFSTGLYYQPPFYRELRSFDGTLNTDIKSQKSAHFVAGMDYQFEMWDRATPFKLSTEAYYKYMWDVNPYEVDNVRIRYYTTNNAVAFAYGLDFNMNGEFIPGMQSFLKVGLLHTAEDLLDDFYYEYINTDGDVITGASENQTIADSNRVEPGYIPRPSDQWVNIAVLFQDRMPVYEKFTVSLGINYGYKLPYGPPDFERYKDVLRQRAYFRTDIGFGYDFLYNSSKEDRRGVFRHLEKCNLSFEIWNLLGIENVLSQQWIQDVNGRYYAIPNYLTSRRFNLKLNIAF